MTVRGLWEDIRARSTRWILNYASRRALARFEARLPCAIAVNEQTLADILRLNAASAFGAAHHFADLVASGRLVDHFRRRVPLSTYADLKSHVYRIQAGELNVLTTDPVHMLAGSSGTTDHPKRIPRTRRAQRHHITLVVLAEQAVLDRDIPGAGGAARGINLMSMAAAPSTEISAVPIQSGPNAGMERLRRVIPLLWCAPETVYTIADPPTALYLHALFALQYKPALYIETPFASQLTGWFALIERHQCALLNDIRNGTLAPHLQLTQVERAALDGALAPNPTRAAELAAAFIPGFAGIIPRLWPGMSYLRTVTSGSFGLSMPRLRWLAGPGLPIHSGCHSSSEGVIGINLRANGTSDYVLAVGAAFFEFIPLADVDAPQPITVDLGGVESGCDYELVLTSCAGLYRYRLGDVIRITGYVGQAPTFEYRYRRGTLLNLVGEKTSEFHTAGAVTATVDEWLGKPGSVKEYTVSGIVEGGRGRYRFYVELSNDVNVAIPVAELSARLDVTLGDLNPYYQTNGRQPERLDAAELRFVFPGTFDDLLSLQLRRAVPATATQIKVPRLVTAPEQLALLESRIIH